MTLPSGTAAGDPHSDAAAVSAPLLIRLGRDGAIRSASPACARVLGRRPGELVGTSFVALFDGPTRKRLRAFLRSSPRERALAVEQSAGGSRGRLRQVRWTVVAVPGSDGAADEALAVGFDTTAEVRRDAALRRAARWFLDFSANLRDGFAAVDLTGRIVEVNPAFLNIVGYPAQEVTSLSYQDLTPERWHGLEREIIETEVAKRGYSSLYEKEYRRRDGSIVPVELRTYLWRDESGEPAGMWAFVRDITRRKKAEDELYDSQQMLRLVLDHIPQRVFWKARDFSYLGCNELFAHDAGLAEPSAIIGRDDFDLAWRETASLYRADDREVMETGQPRLSFEEPQSHPDGSRLWLRTSKVPLRDRAGEIFGVLGTYEDITEQKRAEQALRESEERYRELVENINEVLFTLDRRGTVDFISPVIESIVGVHPAEVIGRVFSDFVAADDLAVAKSLFDKAKRGESRAGELRLLSAGGAARWFRVSVRPIQEDGRLRGLRGLLTDIHERRQAEEALRDSQHYLASVMNLVADPIITVRMPDRTIEYANRAVDDVFGHRAEDLIGRSTRLFYPDEESFATFAQHVDDALRRGEEHLRLEQVLERADGRRIWAELTTTLLFTDGRLVKTINVIRDVTARRQMEEALRRSETTKRAILAAMPDLTFLLARDGTFLELLSGNTAELARPPDEFLGRSITDVLPPELASLTLAHIDQACSTGELQTYEYDLPVGGDLRRFDARMVSMGSDAALAVVRDITERRAMEEQLLQAQKMEAIGRLAGGAAHDFNNLMQAMLSHLELLRAARGDADKVDSTAIELEQQIRRGAALTRQLLLFSRRDAARKELADLNEVVLAAAGLLRRLIRENVAFQLDLASEPLTTELDRVQIEQVLMNLVVNACDAMPDGGRLRIVTTRCSPRTVSFAVADTGCGIAPELRDRIFDPFFTTKAPDAGTGLGLSVVHGIVARHDGVVELESTVGRGSTFRIVLPRAQGAPPAPAEAAGGREGDLPAGHGERILLVEDETAARQALEQTLTMLGYQVETAACGEDVARLAEGPAFDLILTDLLLPDAFGADLADDLRARWPRLRVLLMSGYTTNDRIRRSVEARQVRFLQKPFDMAALARELHAALDEDDPPSRG